MPNQTQEHISFKNHYKSQKYPVHIVADFEAYLKETSENDMHTLKTEFIEKHEINSFGYLIIFSYLNIIQQKRIL
jgi:hypothetical protein